MKMGEKYSDGGQFFTPREVIRAIVHVIDPQPGETIYDPGCGTGGFLAVAYEHLTRTLGNAPVSTDIHTLKHDIFFGREKENLVFPIALANLVLHGIDQPNLWHGNTLTGRTTYGALFESAPSFFDVVLTNPPFGGKEGKDAQKNFSFETGSTQVLFLQHILEALGHQGRCGIVLDEGLLFRTNESAFVETKRKLLDECELWCVVSLPGGVFTTAGAGVKTNLLFFTKGKETRKIWYYDLAHVKVGKKSPLTLAHLGFSKTGEIVDDKQLPLSLIREWQQDEDTKGKPFPTFARLHSKRGTKKGESRFSWTIDFIARRAQARKEMAPYLADVQKLKEQTIGLKEELKRLKKEKAVKEKITTLQDKIKTVEKKTRETLSKANDIDAAVYDLKAVNPNAIAKVDTRTPEEIIKSIEAQGKIVSEALVKLKILLADTN